MAILDAPALKPVLTPEVALGVVQKEVRRRGWKKFDVASIRLVYTPFYTFSSDIMAEGAAAPSAKAAINANSGELNDLVPFLLERPLEKVRESEAGSEVETTSISAQEVKETASVKVAASVGVKRDLVAISAVSKLYVPTYRIWVNVADDTYRVEIDAAVGAAKGFESIPVREKGWGEVTEETVAKMKSPAGWAELISAFLASIPEALSGKGKGPLNTLIGTTPGRIVLLVVVVLVLLWLAFMNTSVGITCETSAGFPKVVRGTMWLNGTCTVSNSGSREEVVAWVIYPLEDGKESYLDRKTLSAQVKASSDTVKSFGLSWNNSQTKEGAFYSVGYKIPR